MLSSATPTPTSNTPSFKIFERIIRKRGRECTRCGGRHRDPLHKYCGPCRDICSAWLKAYRDDHIARKLCPHCVQKKGKPYQMCDYHNDYHNELQRRIYAERKAKGLCVWTGKCKNAVADGTLCEEHKEKERSYREKAARKQSRRWAA